ncbi:hypothetical protein EC99P1_00025 [Enterococcus phage EC99P1]|nr:hypothetical protein EC99P1_00025 [Enterococcus phage EC99P1]
MREEVKQEITKNFTKVNDFIMEATKRELSKTCKEGRFLDHSLDALVAKHDVEQEVEKIIKAFELIDEERKEMVKHGWMMQDFRDAGKASGHALKDFKKLSKDKLARIAELQSSMIYVMADWGYYNSDKESKLTEIKKALEEIYNEA